MSNAIILLLPNNNLSKFAVFLENSPVTNLKMLSLDHNMFTNLFHKLDISQKETFILIYLNISYNFISVVENYAFGFFNKLLLIDLTSNNISTLKAYSFNGLCCLRLLKLTNNFILTISVKLFNSILLTIIWTDVPQICCLATEGKFLCTAVPRNCKRLLLNIYVVSFVWTLGIGILVINSISAFHSVKTLYKSSQRENVKIYRILTINMNCCDFVLGFYLMILGTIDSIFKDKFIEIVGFWRQSFYCSTLANAAFVCINHYFFTMFLTSLCRYLATKFPMKSVVGLKCFKLILISFFLGNSLFVVGINSKNLHSGKNLMMNSLCSFFRYPHNISLTLLNQVVISIYIILSACSLLFYTLMLHDFVSSSKTLNIRHYKSTVNTKYLIIANLINSSWYLVASIAYFVIIFLRFTKKPHFIICHIM